MLTPGTERQRQCDERKRRRGLKAVRVWVKPEHIKAIKAFEAASQQGDTLPDLTAIVALSFARG